MQSNHDCSWPLQLAQGRVARVWCVLKRGIHAAQRARAPMLFFATFVTPASVIPQHPLRGLPCHSPALRFACIRPGLAQVCDLHCGDQPLHSPKYPCCLWFRGFFPHGMSLCVTNHTLLHCLCGSRAAEVSRSLPAPAHCPPREGWVQQSTRKQRGRTVASCLWRAGFSKWRCPAVLHALQPATQGDQAHAHPPYV